MTVRKYTLYVCLSLGLTAVSLSAAPITGAFNLSGIVTATPTTITWQSDLLPNDAQMFTLSGGTGSFSGEDGQNTIDDLSNTTEPVGAAFANTPFIAFDVIPGVVLDINFIFAGTGGSAGCTETPAVTTPPQTCTPTNAGGSPFTFSNDPPPNNIQSTAQFVFTGVTSDGKSDWVGIFNAPFPDEPFQDVLAAFSPGGSGSVTDTFSGTITVTPIPTSSTPEVSPAILLATGLGLMLLSLGSKRLFKDRHNQPR